MSAITDRIEQKLDKMGLKRADLSRATEIHESTLRNWIRGTSPQAEPLYKVAQYLGVTLEYLLTGEEKQAAAKTPDPLIAKIQKLTEAQKEEVEDLVDVKLARSSKEERKIG